jgi:hypothetical protein
MSKLEFTGVALQYNRAILFRRGRSFIDRKANCGTSRLSIELYVCVPFAHPGVSCALSMPELQ